MKARRPITPSVHPRALLGTLTVLGILGACSGNGTSSLGHDSGSSTSSASTGGAGLIAGSATGGASSETGSGEVSSEAGSGEVSSEAGSGEIDDPTPSTGGTSGADERTPSTGGTSGADEPTPSTGGTSGADEPTPSTGGTSGADEPTPSTGGTQITSTGGTSGDGTAGAQETGDVCESALPLRCGDRLAHSTTVQGHPNQWAGYNCTQRQESGRETVYHFSADQDCSVTVRIVNLTTDLDVFMAECDPSSCGSCSSVIEPGWVDAAECSSIPLDLQTRFVEEIGFDVVAGEGHAVLVDGYDFAEGTYTIEVDCACS